MLDELIITENVIIDVDSVAAIIRHVDKFGLRIEIIYSYADKPTGTTLHFECLEHFDRTWNQINEQIRKIKRIHSCKIEDK